MALFGRNKKDKKDKPAEERSSIFGRKKNKTNASEPDNADIVNDANAGQVAPDSAAPESVDRPESAKDQKNTKDAENNKNTESPAASNEYKSEAETADTDVTVTDTEAEAAETAETEKSEETEETKETEDKTEEKKEYKKEAEEVAEPSPNDAETPAEPADIVTEKEQSDPYEEDNAKDEPAPLESEPTEADTGEAADKKAEKPKRGGFFSKLRDGLKKTRGGLLGSIFQSGERINADFYDSLEEALIMADVGFETTESLLDDLKEQVKERKLTSIPEAREVMIELMEKAMDPEEPFALDVDKKGILLIVGVNGVGKTTSIGKLAHYYKEVGREVVLAAADTFRAAAAEQISEWGVRAGVPVIKKEEGADPASVVYDALVSYKAKNRDILICDTAGRLHNKKNLMDELSKIRRVIAREAPDVPVETLLVLDATTGQNAIKQAEGFLEATGLDGLILTKLDGTAKGGFALALKGALGLPIRFVGVGEGMEDMRPFDPDDFARALI